MEKQHLKRARFTNLKTMVRFQQLSHYKCWRGHDISWSLHQCFDKTILCFENKIYFVTDKVGVECWYCAKLCVRIGGLCYSHIAFFYFYSFLKYIQFYELFIPIVNQVIDPYIEHHIKHWEPVTFFTLFLGGSSYHYLWPSLFAQVLPSGQKILTWHQIYVNS